MVDLFIEVDKIPDGYKSLSGHIKTVWAGVSYEKAMDMDDHGTAKRFVADSAEGMWSYIPQRHCLTVDTYDSFEIIQFNDAVIKDAEEVLTVSSGKRLVKSSVSSVAYKCSMAGVEFTKMSGGTAILPDKGLIVRTLSKCWSEVEHNPALAKRNLKVKCTRDAKAKAKHDKEMAIQAAHDRRSGIRHSLLDFYSAVSEIGAMLCIDEMRKLLPADDSLYMRLDCTVTATNKIAKSLFGMSLSKAIAKYFIRRYTRTVSPEMVRANNHISKLRYACERLKSLKPTKVEAMDTLSRPAEWKLYKELYPVMVQLCKKWKAVQERKAEAVAA